MNITGVVAISRRNASDFTSSVGVEKAGAVHRRIARGTKVTLAVEAKGLTRPSPAASAVPSGGLDAAVSALKRVDHIVVLRRQPIGILSELGHLVA